MSEFEETREQLARSVRKVFPKAKPVEAWAGITAWGAPRPAAVVPAERQKGTYDPKLTVIGIADRKAGPTVYFLDPGDYYLLDTHKRMLQDAGLKLGRGCIMHTTKGPFPMDAVEELMRIVKARDAADAKGAKAAGKSAKGAAKKAAKKAPRGRARAR